MLDFAARIETGAKYETAFIRKLKAEGWTSFLIIEVLGRIEFGQRR